MHLILIRTHASMKLAWPLVARRAWNSQIIFQRGWDISLALVLKERNKIIIFGMKEFWELT